MKLSAGEKELVVNACTIAIAVAEKNRDAIMVWRVQNLRKKFERSLRQVQMPNLPDQPLDTIE